MVKSIDACLVPVVSVHAELAREDGPSLHSVGGNINSISRIRNISSGEGSTGKGMWEGRRARSGVVP
jgi:hypothetical protein